MKNKIIAVFGGSFNPPTTSHISLAEQIIEKMDNIEKLIFIPVSIKYNKNGLIQDDIRFDMLKKICDNRKRLELSRIELDSKRQLYTIETLKIIKEENSNKDICFVIGTDNLKEIETWYKADELLNTFKIIVLERDNDIMEDIIKNSIFLSNHKNAFIKLANIEKTRFSSRSIRKNIEEGKSIIGMVPTEIQDIVTKIYMKKDNA